jgi:prolyl 4-hydroxylase
VRGWKCATTNVGNRAFLTREVIGRARSDDKAAKLGRRDRWPAACFDRALHEISANHELRSRHHVRRLRLRHQLRAAMSQRIRLPLLESPYLQGVRLPYVAVVDEALPEDVCAALVARIEAEGPAPAPIMVGDVPVMDTRTRDNERVIFDDAGLATDLFARTRAALPERLGGGALVGYNERFRGYRYRGGQRFAPHYDSAYFRPETPTGREGSQLTALFYLNDGFAGGETRLLDYGVEVAPRQGSLFVFDHAMLHEGCPVTAGTKYVLRSDAMYWFARNAQETRRRR